MTKEEHSAKAMGNDIPISKKHTINICKMIRGKNVDKAKQMLEQVIKYKKAVPFTRFNRDVGHKKGEVAAGRYPIKATTEVLSLLKSAEMNAQNKGLDTNSLFISEIVANKGSSQWRYGRQRRRQAKRTNLRIILEERETETKKKEIQPKQEIKAKKTETKKEEQVKVTKEAPKEEKAVVEKAPKEQPEEKPKQEEKKPTEPEKQEKREEDKK